MSETKKIGAIHVITDTENSYDKIGDVEGGFDTNELYKHVERYGTEQLLETLARMISQVINVNDVLSFKKSEEENNNCQSN